jgi:NAD(P)-dependent dehydrogenase (short-subunit alcohol dehydrogenase family)
MAEWFEGKVALVTGAGSGIGLATARAFAEAGAAVVLADKDEEPVNAAADKLTAAGRNAIAVRCDVTDDAEVASMVEQTASRFGRLDAAFNNAGINCENAPLLERSDDEFDRIIDVNLRGVWNCMKAELRQMMAQGSGAIVNCSSIGGMVGSKGRIGLCPAMFPRHGHTRGMDHVRLDPTRCWRR